MYSTRGSTRLKHAAQRFSLAKRTYVSTSYSAPAPHASRVTDADISAARSYCSNLTRNFDSPSYTLQTFVPPSARDAYLAIRALNIELSRIPDAVTSPAVAALRMQFWRDALTRTFARTPPKEPVAILLHAALTALRERHPEAPTASLRAWLVKVVDARAKYADDRAFPTVEALEAYAEATYSTLLYATLGFVPLHSVAVDHLASHIGKAAGIAAVLRGTPLVAFPAAAKHHSDGAGRPGAVVLPLDAMAEAGARQEDVLRIGGAAPGLRDAVFAVATRANDHLITARSMLGNLRRGEDAGHAFEHEGEEGHEYAGVGESDAAKELERGFGVLMPAVATRLWLERLEKVDFDVFRPEVRGRSLALPWSAYWAYKRGKI